MDTNEAIKTLEEEIERLQDWNRMQEGYLSKPTKTDIYRRNLTNIITLLKQGEVYKAMWEEAEKMIPGHYVNGDFFKLQKQKYLKEA